MKMKIQKLFTLTDPKWDIEIMPRSTSIVHGFSKGYKRLLHFCRNVQRACKF